MADSIPSLRRLVNELRAEIRELKSRPVDVVTKVEYRDRVVDRVVDKPIIQYVDRVVEKIVYRDSPAPPAPPSKVITNTVDVIKEIPIYQDNPDHIATIRKLQEKLCQFTSQSDS